jgi:TolB protein
MRACWFGALFAACGASEADRVGPFLFVRDGAHGPQLLAAEAGDPATGLRVMEQPVAVGALFPGPPRPGRVGAASHLWIESVSGPAGPQERLVLGGEPLHPFVARARNPVWSPDGRVLLAEVALENFSDIVAFEPDVPGAGPRALTRITTGAFTPQFAPDGMNVVFVAGFDGNLDLMTVPLGGGEPRSLFVGPGEDLDPLFSPDGASLVWMRADGAGLGVWRAQADGREAHPFWVPNLGEEVVPDQGFGFDSSGKWLAFPVRRETDMRMVVVAWPSGTVLRAPPTPGSGLEQGLSWDPKRPRFVTSLAKDGDLNLVLVDPLAGTSLPLTSGPGQDWLPRWLAEGP